MQARWSIPLLALLALTAGTGCDSRSERGPQSVVPSMPGQPGETRQTPAGGDMPATPAAGEKSPDAIDPGRPQPARPNDANAAGSSTDQPADQPEPGDQPSSTPIAGSSGGVPVRASLLGCRDGSCK